MSPRYETWLVEGGAAGTGLLKPGRVLRALAGGLGFRAEEIGQITPTGRNGVAVEVRLPRAGEIATPLLLPVPEGDGSTAFLIRREDDERTGGDAELLLTWTEGTAPGPGEVCGALSAATGGAVGPEEVGVGLAGPGWVRVHIPEAMAAHLEASGPLKVGARDLHLSWADGGKKKRLRSAERRLAEALRVTRRRIDSGRLPSGAAPLHVARTARRLLRERPGDAPLHQAVSRLSERSFAPPEPTELPTGNPNQMWTDLSGRAPEDVGALAATLVTLPDPATDLARSEAAMEVLLAHPSELARARRLLDSISEHVAPPAAALWALRIQGAELVANGSGTEAEHWETLLEPLRTACKKSPDDLSAGLHRAAAGFIAASAYDGGPMPALGGRRLALVALTRWRHPDRSQSLDPVASWLEEAADLGPLVSDDPLGAALDAMEALDLSGDFDGAGQALASAIALGGDRSDLRQVVEARAALLNVGPDVVIQNLPRPTLPPPTVHPTDPPEGSWEARITSVTRSVGGTEDEADLAWLEAVGLGGEAADGWLAKGTPEALLQAWRLREHLDGGATGRLVSGLTDATPDDDSGLADGGVGLSCGLALHEVLEAGPRRRILGIRLNVATGAPDKIEDDDPHSAGHRLEAALDHMAEGRHVGAATAAAALLQRMEDPSLSDRLLNLVVDLLALSSPPDDLVRAVNKAMEPGGDLRTPLLRRLASTPGASGAVAQALTEIAGAGETTEHEALLALRGVVGHLSGEELPISPVTIRAMLGVQRTALMALSAAMVGQHPDPVTSAREALLRTPPARSSGESVAREFLALATHAVPGNP